jgi:predicted metalloprotease
MEDREVERETVVVQGGRDGGGGGGAIAAILVILVIAVLAFLFFGGYLQRAADKTDINVNVSAPKIELPDIKIETPPAQQQPATTNKQ